MVRKNKQTAEVATQEVATQEVATPEVAVVETATKAKPVRYAPASILENDQAVVTSFISNPKVAGKLSHARYAKYYRVGITIAQFVAAYKADNLPGVLARNDLRWDFQHGFITLEAPQKAD
jgi:hypothetical protein